MKLGFYPGCSLKGTAREYNESVKALAPVFGIELEDIEDWNCCGASAAHAVNKDLSVALPARVLALAERQGFEEIVVPCAACFNRWW
jgi:heterodisulfide reductase subunit B